MKIRFGIRSLVITSAWLLSFADRNIASAQTGRCPVRIQEPGPASYFMFASEGREHGITAAKIERLVARYGKNVIIGGDPGDENFNAIMAEAKHAGVKRHVYLEGPKGPTGDRGFQGGEWQRLVSAAREFGIDVRSPAGLREWNATGWRKFTRKQILQYARRGFDTYEIDNMDRASGIGSSSSGIVAFIKEQQAWQTANGVTMKLVMKNLSPQQLTAISRAIQSGGIDRNVLADFHIAERGTGSRSAQVAASATMGITTLASNDTYDYDAIGAYDVRACSTRLAAKAQSPASLQ